MNLSEFLPFLMVIPISVLAAGCVHPAGSHYKITSTDRGKIRYELHSPATPPTAHVILAHGFLRNSRTMTHVASSLAGSGVETASIQLRRSRPWRANHDANARDMIALRNALGWQRAGYAGFSAGGLSALIAASEDPACAALLLVDPVDHDGFGLAAAPQIRIPVLAILGKPGPGNAFHNASAMLAAMPDIQIIKIPSATHGDFEARPSAFLHWLTGSSPDRNRTASVHDILIRESIGFFKKKRNIAHLETRFGADQQQRQRKAERR